jgi:N-acetylmuramoyl-L-alanine amidase
VRTRHAAPIPASGQAGVSLSCSALKRAQATSRGGAAEGARKSASILGVRGAILFLAGVGFVALTALGAARIPQQSTPQQTQASPVQQNAPTQPGAPGAVAPPQIAPAVPPEAAHFGPMVILDPGHGGTDAGARGANGLTEKEQVLILARMIRSDLERNGFHVILTRNDDANPSYEDRAAIANAYRDAIFITLHISSTGKFGTVRAYSYAFPAVAPLPDDAAVIPAARPAGLIPWEEAQRGHADASKRLADILQAQFAQKFSGSPGESAAYAVRDLRSVAQPAVAIEISSVAVPDPNSISAMGSQLAIAVVRSVQLFRPVPGLPTSVAPSLPTGGGR